MQNSVNNTQYWANIKNFKIPSLPYTPKLQTSLTHDSLELSNLQNYINTKNKRKKYFPVVASVLAAGTAVAAFLQTATGKKAVDFVQMQRLLRQFKKFDLSKVLDKVPDDKTLTACLDSALEKVELNSVFNEAQATKTDIQKLLQEYIAGFSTSVEIDRIAEQIANDSKAKHAFNNLLSLLTDKNGVKDTVWIDELEDICINNANIKNISRQETDILFKILKDDNCPTSYLIDELTKLFNNKDSAMKIKGLNKYLEKVCPNIGEKIHFKNLLYGRHDLSFDDYAKFITSLRQGNLKGSLHQQSTDFDFKIAGKFLDSLNNDAIKLINLDNLGSILQDKTVSPKALSQKLNHLDKDKIKQIYISNINFNTFFELENFLGVKNINELDAHQKRDLMQKLVKNNADIFSINNKLFPILPKTKEQYCVLLQKLSKSIGIGTKPLTSAQIANFQKTIESIATSIEKVDLNNATLSLKISREDFIAQAEQTIKKLKQTEQNKVMDYFGFEIKDGKLIGYPININNGEKLKEISSKKTKKVIEALRPLVEEYSNKSNTVKITGCKNAQGLEKDLNQLFEAFPELRNIVGRKQHETHAFTLDIHTLKVLQNVCSNEKFKELSNSDKKILEISALLHDITKAEGVRDITHPFESAFDAYYIIQKLNLPESEQLKAYQLIKTHNWLDRLNNPKNKNLIQNIAQDVAFDSRHTNTFELAKILCEADLKSVKKDGSFFKQHEKTLEDMSNLVDSYVKRLHETQIVLPQTKIPIGSTIQGAVEKSSGGIKNKVIYMDKAGDNLSVYGFDKNTTKDNFLALVHALDHEDQMIKFNTFSTIDTEALLSSSYIKADDYHVFRKQGLILDVAYDDIHAGYYMDFGTGYSKSIELLKQDYLFHGTRKDVLERDGWRHNRTRYRDYISELIKTKLNLSNEEYIERLEKIKDCKTITDIEQVDKNFADGLLDVFKNMQSGKRRGGRSYNEMLISRPRIQGVFAYDRDYESIPKFLRKYAQDNDLPIIIFGKG